jgi:hypothetical protein
LNYGTKEKGLQKYGDLANFSNLEVRLLRLCLGSGAASVDRPVLLSGNSITGMVQQK